MAVTTAELTSVPSSVIKEQSRSMEAQRASKSLDNLHENLSAPNLAGKAPDIMSDTQTLMQTGALKGKATQEYFRSIRTDFFKERPEKYQQLKAELWGTLPISIEKSAQEGRTEDLSQQVATMLLYGLDRYKSVRAYLKEVEKAYKVPISKMISKARKEYNIEDTTKMSGRRKLLIGAGGLAGVAALGAADRQLGWISKLNKLIATRDIREFNKAPEVLPTMRMFKDIIVPKVMDFVSLRRQTELKNLAGVDVELNKDGFTFVFLGIGIEEQTIAAEQEFNDSTIIIHYSKANNGLYMFNIPRDTHAPEVDRLMAKLKNPRKFNAINTAVIEGKKAGGDGYGLVREIVADATALSPDLIGKAKIWGVVNALAGVLGGRVRIYVPESIDSTKEGGNVKWDVGYHDMTPLEAVNYGRSRKSTSEVERNGRQQLVIDTIFENLVTRWNEGNPLVKAKLLYDIKQTIEEQQKLGNLNFDFDIGNLLLNSLGDVAKNVVTSPNSFVLDRPQTKARQVLLPEVTHPEGYTQREALWEKRDNAQVVRPHLVTTGGDYNSPDLRQGYWQEFRKLVSGTIKGALK